MKHLETFEKYAVVNFSDLADNWSPEFHLDPAINYYKNQFKVKGRKNIIDLIVKNIKKIGKTNYSSIKKYTKENFFVTLPAYEQAIETSYWNGKYGTQSKIIICLSALDSGVKKQKEKIQEDIEKLTQRLKDLEIEL